MRKRGAAGERVVGIGPDVGLADGRSERQRMNRDTQIAPAHQCAVRLEPRFELVRGVILPRLVVAGFRSFDEIENDESEIRRHQQRVNAMAPLRRAHDRVADEQLAREVTATGHRRCQFAACRGLVVGATNDGDAHSRLP